MEKEMNEALQKAITSLLLVKPRDPIRFLADHFSAEDSEDTVAIAVNMFDSLTIFHPVTEERVMRSYHNLSNIGTEYESEPKVGVKAESTKPKRKKKKGAKPKQAPAPATVTCVIPKQEKVTHAKLKEEKVIDGKSKTEKVTEYEPEPKTGVKSESTKPKRKKKKGAKAEKAPAPATVTCVIPKQEKVTHAKLKAVKDKDSKSKQEEVIDGKSKPEKVTESKSQLENNTCTKSKPTKDVDVKPKLPKETGARPKERKEIDVKPKLTKDTGARPKERKDTNVKPKDAKATGGKSEVIVKGVLTGNLYNSFMKKLAVRLRIPETVKRRVLDYFIRENTVPIKYDDFRGSVLTVLLLRQYLNEASELFKEVNKNFGVVSVRKCKKMLRTARRCFLEIRKKPSTPRKHPYSLGITNIANEYINTPPESWESHSPNDVWVMSEFMTEALRLFFHDVHKLMLQNFKAPQDLNSTSDKQVKEQEISERTEQEQEIAEKTEQEQEIFERNEQDQEIAERTEQEQDFSESAEQDEDDSISESTEQDEDDSISESTEQDEDDSISESTEQDEEDSISEMIKQLGLQ